MLIVITMVLNQRVQLIGQNSREYKMYYPVELQGAWSTFMNSNAVWVDNYENAYENIEQTLSFTFTASYSGEYIFEYSADDQGSLILDDNSVASFTSFGSFRTSEKTILNLNKGKHKGKLLFLNSLGGRKKWRDNPAGIALKISDKSGKVLFSTRDQSVIGMRMKEYDTVTLQVIEYSCGDCCYITFKDVNSGEHYHKDHFDKITIDNNIIDEIATIHYDNSEDSELDKFNMFYTAYIQYRRPQYHPVSKHDEWGCSPAPLSKRDKTKYWMINRIVRKR